MEDKEEAWRSEWASVESCGTNLSGGGVRRDGLVAPLLLIVRKFHQVVH